MSREKDFIEAAERLAETKRTEDAKQQCLYDFGIAADYGYQYALQHPHWIPVEERLPEENEQVIAYNGVYNEIHLCDYHDGMFEDYFGPFDGTITHWMEIVPPRKED